MSTSLVQRKVSQSVLVSVHIPAYLGEMQVLVHITQVNTHQLLIKRFEGVILKLYGHTWNLVQKDFILKCKQACKFIFPKRRLTFYFSVSLQIQILLANIMH